MLYRHAYRAAKNWRQRHEGTHEGCRLGVPQWRCSEDFPFTAMKTDLGPCTLNLVEVISCFSGGSTSH